MDVTKLEYELIPRHLDKVKLHFSRDGYYECTESDRPIFPLLEEVF
jgi:hypothetical protein